MINIVSPSPFSGVSFALLGLAKCVGGWRSRGFLSFRVHWLLYGRLAQGLFHFERLVARYQLGMIRRRALRVAGVTAAVVAGDVRAPRTREWPGRFGWLLRALNPAWLPIERVASWEAAQHGALLEHALGTAEVQALLRDVPQASRILGPICRMLAIPPSVCRPGFVAKVRAAPDPSARRVRRKVVVAGPKLHRGAIRWKKIHEFKEAFLARKAELLVEIHKKRAAG